MHQAVIAANHNQHRMEISCAGAKLDLRRAHTWKFCGGGYVVHFCDKQLAPSAVR